MRALHVHELTSSGSSTLLAGHGVTGHGGRWRVLTGEHLPSLNCGHQIYLERPAELVTRFLGDG
jgi:hypothetical protein